jgi:hypothetical protein
MGVSFLGEGNHPAPPDSHAALWEEHLPASLDWRGLMNDRSDDRPDQQAEVMQDANQNDCACGYHPHPQDIAQPFVGTVLELKIIFSGHSILLFHYSNRSARKKEE